MAKEKASQPNGKNNKSSAKKQSSHGKKKIHKESLEEKVEKFEEKLDKSAEKLEKRIEKTVSPKAKERLHHLADSAGEIGDGIEGVADSVDEFAHALIDERVGSEAVFTATFDPKVSRFFIFRFLWLIIEYRIILVWSIIISIVMILHRLYMLIFWKRLRDLRDMEIRYRRHIIKWKAYLSGTTDKRPDFIEK